MAGKKRTVKSGNNYVLFTRYGRLIKSRILEGADYIARMREMGNEYKF
jgi:hypothetical protein